MKNDKKIISEVKKLETKCKEYLSYVDEVSQNAYSDRILEELIDISKNVSTLYDNNTAE